MSMLQGMWVHFPLPAPHAFIPLWLQFASFILQQHSLPKHSGTTVIGTEHTARRIGMRNTIWNLETWFSITYLVLTPLYDCCWQVSFISLALVSSVDEKFR